jgi:phenylacetate-CoA ligase
MLEVDPKWNSLCSPQVFLRAREEVVFAYENQPMFREHLASGGLTPDDLVTPADLLAFPPTKKSSFRRGFPGKVLARGRSLQDRFVHRSPSSGTGGERLLTVAHTYALAERMNATMMVHPLLRTIFLTFVHHRPARFAAPNCSDVECASPRTTISDRILPDGTLVLPVAHDLLATPAAIVDQALAEIDAWQPDWLYTDPTHLAFLIRESRRRGIGPPSTCRGLALTYTATTRVSRRQIAEFFPLDVPSAEILSMSELGWIAMECPFGTLHLNNQTFYVELVTDGRLARTGEMGELFVTSIGDRLCPHVRYKTGDVYRLLPDCDCGHEFPAVRHEGRNQDMLMNDSGVLLTPRQLDAMINFDFIDVYKLEQLGETTFRFRWIANNRRRLESDRMLKETLRDVLGAKAELRVEQADYIEADRSGKFLSCVSQVAQNYCDDHRSR